MTWENLDALFSYSTSHAGIVFCHFTASRTLRPFWCWALYKSDLCLSVFSVRVLQQRTCYEVQKSIKNCNETYRVVIGNWTLKNLLSALQRILFFLRSPPCVALTYSPWYLLSGYSEPYVLKCSSISAFCSLKKTVNVWFNGTRFWWKCLFSGMQYRRLT